MYYVSIEEIKKSALMMKTVIRVVMNLMNLMDLMDRIRLKPITKAVDLRTTVSACKVHTAREPNQVLTSE